MTAASARAVRPSIADRPSFADRYVGLLAFSLFGYAMLGKGFAYVGIPPLFIGEVVLACGLILLLRSGTILATLAAPAALLLLAMMGWTLLRTIPFVEVHGVSAFRDSVIVMYGLFAFIVIGLLIEEPARLDRVVDLYRRFAAVYVVAIPVIYVALIALKGHVAQWPVTGAPMEAIRGGEMAVHLAGAAVFTLLGFRRPTWVWMVMLMAGMVIVFSLSRGGSLAILLPLALAAIFGGKLRHAAIFSALAVLLLGIGYALDIGFRFPGVARGVEVRQVIDNFVSIFVSTGPDSLEGTKEFRMQWWSAIVAYTFDGPHFWGGKGFGVNLAVDDGFVVGLEHGGPPLRSPHNAHMTILARSGVPGLALWVLFCLAWFATLLLHMWHARRRGEGRWANLFLFLACYVAANLINASFDVALEGPMLGIWFWVLIGLGIGSTMLYRFSVIVPASGRRRGGATAAAVGLLALAMLPQAAAPAAAGDPAAACPTFRGLEDAVIEDLEIGPCEGHGLSLVDSRRVVVRRVRIRDTTGAGIHVLGSEDITLEENRIDRTRTGIFVQGSGRIRVDCNQFTDARGPIPGGQFVQFNTVRGPDNRIRCNVGRNRPGFGRPEDAISLYKSSGVPGSPIRVEANRIVGGGPSRSGGGIMLGDDGGAHQAAVGNVLVDPGQYGIGVASGTGMLISDNQVYARMQHFTNVGIYVWNQYPHRCGDVTVSGNRVRWRSQTGAVNPWWDGDNCGVVAGLEANDLAADLSAAIADEAPAQCRCAAR